MICLSILPTTLLGLVISATQPYVIAANKPTDVYRLAKQSTILIDGLRPGSGVIIGKQGNSYFVLTAEHVVATEDEYEVVTPDGSRYRLDYGTVKKLPNVDLAVVSFRSNNSYPQAKLGNSDNVTEGDEVFIAGWPAPGKALPHVYQITSGEISGISPRPVARGYRLIYTNVTRAGMSGGPIFNESGKVIGIHGLAEGREVYQSGYEKYPIKTGFNLGIPINTFSRAAKRVDTNIAQLPSSLTSSPPVQPQITAKPAHVPTAKTPPVQPQITAKPAQVPTAKTPPVQPQTTIKLSELLDNPLISTKKHSPRLTFAQSPRLVSSQATSKNAKELGATYYFTIDVPTSAKLPLQQINLTLKQGVEYPRFKAKAVEAFEGTPKNKGPELLLGLIITDPPTRTLTVVFNSPVLPGKGVTIAVRPVRNPSIGTYQFEATAFPEGENAQGQFAGLGRFDFYRSSK